MNDTINDQQPLSFPTSTPRLKRIVVVGTAGSGKTTMAQQLSQQLGIPHVELDALFWDANWTPAPPETFRERVATSLSAGRWIVDGNYSKVSDLTWGRADTIIWLDYSLWTIMTRLLWRTVKRAITQEELWSGNRESLLKAAFSRDSIIAWALKTYATKRRRYLAAMHDPAFAHLDFIQLRSPRAAQAWLARLKGSADQQ